MKINIIRQDNHLSCETLNTIPLPSIEFMLDDNHCICAMIEDGKLYISSSIGRLRITPRTSNAITIEVTE